MDKLIEKINKLKSPIVVGLDTALKFIPNSIKQQAIVNFDDTPKAAANAILNFNKKIVDAIFDIVPAVKIQCAYYELFGFEGVWAMQQTITYCKNKGLFTIVDGKRNDINSSMQAYSDAYLGQTSLLNETKFNAFNCDAMTINPYLGNDGITPVADNCAKFDKCAFMLVKTSNPSSSDFQNLKLENGLLVYEQIAQLCNQFDDFKTSKYGFNKIGAVTGATYPDELKNLRAKLPHTFFLVPGFGAQGATAQNIKPAFNENRTGAIVNSSRAILGAWLKQNCSENEFAQKARQAAIKMQNEIMNALNNN